MTQSGKEADFSGKVTNVFRPIGCVAILILKGTLRKGDVLVFFKEHHRDQDGCPCEYEHEQKIDSIEIDHKQVTVAKQGQKCGVKIHPGVSGLPPNNAGVIKVRSAQQLISREKRSPYFVQ
jgi:translation elongation factor EF-1alpha